MLTTTTRFYQSSDAGAPVNLGVSGGLITILKAVLVGTGGIAYGTKPALGWTLVWEDTGAYVAVFRNNTNYGNGMYIRVDDSNALYTSITGYEVMTDINAGVRGTFTRYVFKCSSASVPQQWQIVGDQRTFYGQIWRTTPYRPAIPNTAMNTSVFGGGDFIRLDGRPGIFVTGKTGSGSATSADFFGTNADSAESEGSITTSRHAKTVRVTGLKMFTGTPIGYAIGNHTLSYAPQPSAATLWTRISVNTLSYPFSVLGYLRGIWIPLAYPFTGDEPAGTIINPYMTNQFGRLVSLVGSGANSGSSNWIVGAEIDRSWDTEV